MVRRKCAVARTESHLRERVVSMLRPGSRLNGRRNQLNLFGDRSIENCGTRIVTPMSSIANFLDFLHASLPTGDLYLFGGILRDLALYGVDNFSSDIDLVVESDWTDVTRYLESRGATRNRFGGLRLHVDDRPIDIWNAQETWAIREGLVTYRGIGSLTKTTILNWDAILLNWRTHQVICDRNYFRQLNNGVLDIVLTENPNPLGAVVRAFRHMCLHEAKVLTVTAARFLHRSANKYSRETIIESEISSYGESVIDPSVLIFVKNLDTSSGYNIRRQFGGVSTIVQPFLI